MENLEKKLSDLPKPKLSKKTDFKIKFKIYSFILLRNLQRSLRPYSMLAKVSYAVLAILIFLGSSAVYATNNDSITPGHTLYPLKKTVENVEQNLSFTKNAQVDTLNKISERRLKEALNMAQENVEVDNASSQGQNNSNIKHSLDEVVDNLEEAVITSKEISNEKSAKKAKEAIKEKNEGVIKYLDDLENIAKDKNDQEVSEKINEAKEAVKKYQKILDDEEEDDRPSINEDNSFIKGRKDNRSDEDRQEDNKDFERESENNRESD